MAAQDKTPDLYFRLLGPPRVFLAGEEITEFRTAKSQALLFYLAIAGSKQRRATLADLLWQDANEQQAGASLRSALYNLRQLLGDFLEITRQTVALVSPHVGCDVLQFEKLLRRSGDPQSTVVQLQAAVSLFSGDFLEGFHVSNAAGFELWAAHERARLRDSMLNSLLTLVDWHSGRQDFTIALDHTNRLLSLEPASELGHRYKMDLLARTGRRSAALAQYETCKRVLREELDVLPSPDSTALYELILAGKHGAGDDTATPPQVQPPSAEHSPVVSLPAHETPVAPLALRVDYGEMPRRMAFFGRRRDLAGLLRWLTADHCSLVVVEGMGGVGKTTLATEAFSALARVLSPQIGDEAPDTGLGELQQSIRSAPFERMVWRSLVNAPTLSELLGDLLETLLDQPPEPLPKNLNDRLFLLFKALDRQRCLLVLDNAESILAAGIQTGQFRQGYQDYSQLIERTARGRHRSCLLLTTRELPRGVRRLEEDLPAVRILSLAGLSGEPGAELFKARGVRASGDVLDELVRRYSGNPLALKLVADTVRDLFGGDVESFLSDDAVVFDDIRDVLDQQFSRLNDLEREIVVWLAVEREPVAAQTLWDDLLQPPRRSDFIEVMRSLRRGSLVEQTFGASEDQPARLGLPNVVMEYVTDRLTGTISHEIATGQPDWLHRFALLKAQSKEYVQQTQRRLVLEPVTRQLVERLGSPGAVQKLCHILSQIQVDGSGTQGYAGANILHLLLHLRADLRKQDFSGLAIWQADLRNEELPAVDFGSVDFGGSVFLDTFGGISSVAVSPGNDMVVAGGTDGVIHVWQTADFKQVRLLDNQDLITVLAFTEDGRFLASGGVDTEVRLWDMQTGAWFNALQQAEPVLAWTLAIRGDLLAIAGVKKSLNIWNWQRRENLCSLAVPGLVHGVALSPDGKLVAAVGESMELGVWETASGRLVHMSPTTRGGSLAVAFSPNGDKLATGGEDNLTKLWDVAAMQPYKVLTGHSNWVLTLSFLADGKQLVSGSADHTARVWDIESGRMTRLYSGHGGWVRTLACSGDGRTIYSSGDDQTVRVWDAASGELRHYFQGYKRWVDFVQFSPDGQLLASRGVSGDVRLWDAHSGRLLHQLTREHVTTRALAFSGDGSLLAVGSDDHVARLWNTRTGALLCALRGHGAAVRHIEFSPDNRFVITGSHDDTLRVWEIATGDQRLVVEGATAPIQFAVGFDPVQRLVATGALDSTIKLLDLTTMHIAASIPLPEATPNVVAISPHGNIMACGTREGGLWLWEADHKEADAAGRWRNPRQLRLAEDAIWRVLFSPDGQYLATSSLTSETFVVDAGQAEVCYSVPSYYGAFCLGFNHDGRWMATAGSENTIVVRETATGHPLQVLRGHTATLTSLSFNPCGQSLASSGADGVVRLWNWQSGECVAVLEPPGPYAGMNITGVKGVTRAQKSALIALGAVSDDLES